MRFQAPHTPLPKLFRPRVPKVPRPKPRRPLSREAVAMLRQFAIGPVSIKTYKGQVLAALERRTYIRLDYARSWEIRWRITDFGKRYLKELDGDEPAQADPRR
jgi:hypothetical protein